MDIVVKTTYDLDAFKAMNRIVAFRGKSPAKRLVWMAVASVFVAAVMVFMTIHARELLPLLIACCIIDLLCVGVTVYMAVGLPRVQLKAHERFGLPDITYTFGEAALSYQTSSENYTDSGEIKYAAFAKAVETDEYFFLYQTANQIMIVDKSGIQNGSAEDIRERLKYHLGSKIQYIKTAK